WLRQRRVRARRSLALRARAGSVRERRQPSLPRRAHPPERVAADPPLQPVQELPVGRRSERGLVPPLQHLLQEGSPRSVRAGTLRSSPPPAGRSRGEEAREGVRAAPPPRRRDPAPARGAPARGRRGATPPD